MTKKVTKYPNIVNIFMLNQWEKARVFGGGIGLGNSEKIELYISRNKCYGADIAS